MKIASSKLQIEKYYVRGSGLGGGIGDIISIVNCQLSTINYLHYNHRGDVVLTTDESGNKVEEYEYNAFGLPITDQPITDNRFIGFSSKEFDKKSGLSYYGFRFYDSESGRWMKKEPTGYDGPNLYHFVFNSPVLCIDYYGLKMKGLPIGQGSFNNTAHKLVSKFFDSINMGKDAKNDALNRYGIGIPGFKGTNPQVGGSGDAYRHCKWACKLTRKYGSDFASTVLDHYEKTHPNPDKRDKDMDEHNNKAGIKYGENSCTKDKPCSSLCSKGVNDGTLTRYRP